MNVNIYMNVYYHVLKCILSKSIILIQIDYHKKQWVCIKQLESKPEELSVWTFEATEDGKNIAMVSCWNGWLQPFL